MLNINFEINMIELGEKEKEMINSISLNNFCKKRLDKLITELNKIVESIKEQEKVNNFYEE
jgi:hypothetical protein